MIRDGDPPRWRAIVRWLEEHKREICEAEKGHVKINYAGETSVAFEIFRVEVRREVEAVGWPG